MRLGSSLLLLALTAGFAALALATARPPTATLRDAPSQDVDAWFV
jgi:hypothetical protein